MKKRLVFIPFFFISVVCSAQMIGYFSYAEDNRVYFFLENRTNYSYSITVAASSPLRNDTKSENQFVQPGRGLYVGPTTPWAWQWCEGDTFTVYYQNGTSQTWRCPYHDYNSVSFKEKDVTLRIVGGGLQTLRAKKGIPPGKSTEYIKYEGAWYPISSNHTVKIGGSIWRVPR